MILQMMIWHMRKPCCGKNCTGCRYISSSKLLKMQRIKIICMISAGWTSNYWNRGLFQVTIGWQQDLFNAEVKQLTEKLKKYQIEEVANQTQFSKVQQECAELQTKLMSLQSSRNMLEARLKDETSARSQLVSQLFNLRKVHFQHPFTRRLSAYSHVTLVRFTLKD